MPLSEDDIRRHAQNRVHVFWHAAIFLAVNVFFALLYWGMGDGKPEFHWSGGYYWPGWFHLAGGLALAVHAVFAYAGPGMQERAEQRLRNRSG